MLIRVAELAVRRHRLVLVGALVAFLISAAVGGGVADRLSSGGFDDPDAESTEAEALLRERFGAGTPNVVLLVTVRGGADTDTDAEAAVDDPGVASAGRALAADLAAERFDGLAMTQVLSYWDLPPGNPLASDAGDRALVLGRYPGDDDKLVELSHDLVERYTTDDPSATIQVAVGGRLAVIDTLEVTNLVPFRKLLDTG